MEQGSPETYRVLVDELATRELDAGQQRVKVTRTKCLSPCQAAPVACVYPSGAFYAQLTPDVVPAFVEHVLVEGGELPGKTFHVSEIEERARAAFAGMTEAEDAAMQAAQLDQQHS
jgi:(2Fe-2S) ferredoxin